MKAAPACLVGTTLTTPARLQHSTWRNHGMFSTIKRDRIHCVRRVSYEKNPSNNSVARCGSVKEEGEVGNMSEFLDSLKWDAQGLAVAIAQHVDTGEILMQAFVDRAAVNETLQTGLATFYSRSRKGRWCKGETSGHFIKVQDVYLDCDKDSIIYLSEPIGPACHTNAPTCYFTQVCMKEDDGGSPYVQVEGEHTRVDNAPMTTLYSLERTIHERKANASTEKPSWTVKLLNNPELCCKKVREEAGELCQTWEENEGKERAASEAADLLYHTMVLLNVQGVTLEDVSAELRKRFGTSGIEEKASRKAS